ncbi:MAG: hypothetical protein QOE29_1530 [Gaiellaceae bacterium]|nr:hypothetical protein [Gaiellaceae bacterium]
MQRSPSGRLRALGISRSYGGRVVFEAVDLGVGADTRLALLGPNGCGKTTLLRLLAGVDEPDEGTVERTGVDVAYLPQERPRGTETVEESLRRRCGLADAEQELERAAGSLATGGASDAYEHALARFGVLAEDFDARVRAVCADLRVDAVEAPLAQLSGGQQARVALAAVALARADVLLLDEPTNDLDTDALEWLARYLEGFDGGLVVATHDRDVAGALADELLLFEPGSRTPRPFVGSPDELVDVAARERAAAYDRFERTEERRRALESLLRARQNQARAGRRMTSRRGTKALRTKVRSASRALERLDRPEKPFEPWQLQLALSAASRGSDVVARLERAVVERGAFRLGPLDLELRPGDRLLVAGPNGAGKSTLLGALTGELPLASGTRTIGQGTVFGTLDQDRALLSGPQPVLEAVRAGTGTTETETRTTLAKFGLRRDDALRAGATLTPGERTRAQLALLVLRRMNALVLDEPSNHLDLEALDQLTAALADYPGAAVLVTHDERLRHTFGATQTIRL